MAIDDAADSEESEQDDFQDVKSKSILTFFCAANLRTKETVQRSSILCNSNVRPPLIVSKSPHPLRTPHALFN